jgi:hypothetical protein
MQRKDCTVDIYCTQDRFMLFRVGCLQIIWQCYSRMSWPSWCRSPTPGPECPASQRVHWIGGFFLHAQEILQQILLRMDIKNINQMDVMPPDVSSFWKFCPHRCFVPWMLCLRIFGPTDICLLDILSRQMFCSSGRFVCGCFVSGRFVWAPCCTLVDIPHFLCKEGHPLF